MEGPDPSVRAFVRPQVRFPWRKVADVAGIEVLFECKTGLPRPVFRNPRLRVSADAQGCPTDGPWTEIPMEEIRADDGCPSFRAHATFAESAVGSTFRWSVTADTDAAVDTCVITFETDDPQTQDLHRSFVLEPGGVQPQYECYTVTLERVFGARKRYWDGDEPGLQFAVWAPNARAVEVLWADFDPGDSGRQTGYVDDHDPPGGVDPDDPPIALVRDRAGVWRSRPDEPALRDFSDHVNRPYVYRITRSDGSVRIRTDLYSRTQIGRGDFDPADASDPRHADGVYRGHYRDLDGTKSCSLVVDIDQVNSEFDTACWPEPRPIPSEAFWVDDHVMERPRRVEDLVIYELHIGSLGWGKATLGSFFDALEPDFIEHLVQLGVNAVELLPVLEFRGKQDWGYSTSHYFAIESSAGERDQFKHFVRALHARGISVICDLVFNHYHHDAERAQWHYDSPYEHENCYYWYEGRPTDHPDHAQRMLADPATAHRADHGGYVDNGSTGWAPNYRAEMVRRMFVSSALMLAEEFHADGFRLDLTNAIHQNNVRHADGVSMPEVNAFGCKLLRELTRTLKLVKPDLMLIAEDHSDWDGVTKPIREGGLGFDARWHSAFYHHLIGDARDRGPSDARLLSTAGLGDDRALAVSRFAQCLAGTSARDVVYVSSHDEVGNAHGTRRTLVAAVDGAPLVGETRAWAERRAGVVAALTVLSAGAPMLFMGEEVGAAREVHFDRVFEGREDIVGMATGSGATLFRWWKTLIGLCRRSACLREAPVEILGASDLDRTLVFRRLGEIDEFLVIASLRNHPAQGPSDFESPLIEDGSWKVVATNVAPESWGAPAMPRGAVLRSRGGKLVSVVPVAGVVVLERVDE